MCNLPRLSNLFYTLTQVVPNRYRASCYLIDLCRVKTSRFNIPRTTIVGATAALHMRTCVHERRDCAYLSVSILANTRCSFLPYQQL